MQPRFLARRDESARDAQILVRLHDLVADEDDAVSYGVVDEVARRVRLTGGRVLAVRRGDVPGGGPAAAILRYAI